MEFLETVDQGSADWKGSVGLITTLFPKFDLGGEPWSVIICGPPIMYKFVIRELRRLQVPNQNIFVSLERRMKCGVGKCGHCQMNGVYVCQKGLQKQSDGISLSGYNGGNRNDYRDEEQKAPVLERLKRWVQGNF